MADPLSVAASIAGLISVADVVFTRLVKYGKAVNNAEKELKELTKDVNLLGGSLDSLSRLARALEDGSFSKNLHMDYIDDCNEMLEEMKEKLGAGKTVLAAAIIEAVLDRSTGSIATAFFFCDYKNPITHSPETILGVLAFQLSIQNDDAFTVLLQYYDELNPKQGLPKSPDVPSLKVLLQSVLKIYDHAYLIIDGLDECGNMTEDVVDVLVDTFEEADNVSVALLSRDEDGIRDRLSDCCVPIDVAAHKHDIMEYVTAQVQERIRVGKLSAYDPELKAEIIQGLVDGAKGMFRWVSCQLDHLKDCVSDQDCRDALLALPPTLDETYARILRRIPKGKRRLLQLALQFIAYASPKLTIRQLREALSVPERDTLLESRQIIHLNAITKHCSSLVRESSDGQYLEFSHFSVQEFLKTLLSQDPDLVGFCVSESLSHRLLAVECLRFLQLRNFHRLRFDPETEEEEIQDREDDFPFYSYAAEHWPSYARHSWDDAQVLDLAKLLFHPNKSPYFTSWAIAFANAIGDIAVDVVTADFVNPSFTPLHMASALSLEEICSFLIEQGASVNIKSEAGCPLQCAVQGLLFMSASRDDCDGRIAKIMDRYHGTMASEKTLKRLYHAGASLDTTSTQIYAGESLLEVAFRSTPLSGRLCVATMLINLGIPIRDKDLGRANEMFRRFNGRCPDEYEEKYMLSLQPFIESLDQRSEKSSATLRLCSLAWEAAIRAKLAFTFDVMAIDTRVTLTLEELEKQAIAAIAGFSPQALQKIMSDPRFQAPNVSDKGGNTLLHLALKDFGYNPEKAIEITRLLLSAGCDILRTNDYEQQPLHVWDNNMIEEEQVTWPSDSSRQVFRELMQMITEMGATCTSRDARGKNALHYHIISPYHLQAVLDAQPIKNITAASEAINGDGYTPLTLSLKLGFLVSASILIKTLEMTPLVMASPIPILALAVNANASEILDLLIPLASKSDLESESPLHHVGPGATASNIRRLKTLYSDACNCRLHGKTPLEAYIERCLKQSVADGVDQDVVNELSLLESDNADISDDSKVWERFAQSAASSESQETVTSAGMSLLRVGYMRTFERKSGISGIVPILSSFNGFETTVDLQPISTELICLILHQTERKTHVREEPQMSRLLGAAAQSLDFELATLLLTSGSA
ncbi:hypothetical protein CGMCC3_g11654 [Colletotrichum fructicola]|nr:uncharacterized protein CGMCC3_g11654 [Colletotrichum fructicola]KAE9572344.1 hypothetical protein CGMCC3_g11654 [Colletotrichum fructicola]